MRSKHFCIGSLLALSITLSGCDGSSESAGDISVTVEGDTIDESVTNNTTTPVVETPDPTPEAPSGLCAQVVEASFVTFNEDCSQGTLAGTVDTAVSYTHLPLPTSDLV